MKILQVMAGNDHGGAETAFVDMCIAMRDAGMDIEVATRDNPIRVSALEKAGIKVHTLPFGGPIDIYTSWRAAQKTPNWKQIKTPQRYLVASRLGGYYKVKNFKSADYFNTITPDIKRHLVEGGIDENRIQFIPNFAETDDVGAVVSKQSLETPDNVPVALCLGRLHPSKAYDVLLKAMVDVPSLYVWIAGEGPSRGALETLAKELGVDGRVRFLGWRTDRGALLAACDMCIFASRHEPFGTVFVQSWAAKRPVIVSDAEGPRQFCVDGEDSLVVPREDSSALSNAIQRVLNDDALRKNMVKNGYQKYQSEFTKEKSVSGYLDFFLRILKSENII
jgi:glycosyltransferase involved in cell wall biosynthesis